MDTIVAGKDVINGIDASKHHAVVDANGEKQAILIPIKEYELIMLLLERAEFLEGIEKSIHGSLDELAEVKAGKKSFATLQSLIDEL